MNILITMQKGSERDIYFPDEVINEIKKLGNVLLNENSRPFTEKELCERIKDIDVCITHWACPSFTEEVLKNAGRLKMLAHAAGSVADVATDMVFEKGIKVCSANRLMARYVAEGVLTYMLSALRLVTEYDRDMKNRVEWSRRVVENRTLIGERIGLIGLGTIGRYLLDFLKPFDVRIKLFDPYISRDSLAGYSNVELCPLDEVLSWGNIISIHASLTQETKKLITEEKLKLIRNGTLFVNTARGQIVDEAALVKELESGRIRAVMDVYNNEPLDVNSPLRRLENVILFPHVAGAPVKEQMTYTVIEEIKRLIQNIPLEHEITFERYKMMTREKEQQI